MDHLWACGYDPRDEVSERPRGPDRRRPPRGDNGAGETAGMTLLAQGRNDGRKLALRC